MSNANDSSNLRELALLIERFAELVGSRRDDDYSFSVLGPAAHPTGKTGNLFLRAPDITTEMVGAWVKRALDKRVGARRDHAVDEIASLIGVDAKTVGNQKAGTAPNSQNLFRYIAFFGPEFASELFAPLGLTVVESDSAHAAQSLDVECLTALLPQLRNQIASLEQSLARKDEGEGAQS